MKLNPGFLMVLAVGVLSGLGVAAGVACTPGEKAALSADAIGEVRCLDTALSKAVAATATAQTVLAPLTYEGLAAGCAGLAVVDAEAYVKALSTPDAGASPAVQLLAKTVVHTGAADASSQ
jgi:hypothetical protein